MEMFTSRWTLIKLGTITAVLVLLYASVIRMLVFDWLHLGDFSHGFLIPLVSLYLVYERRKRIIASPRSGSRIGVVWLALGLLLLLFGKLAFEWFTMEISLLIVIGGIILYLLGIELFKTVFFPLAFLIFMIPLPSLVLQKITFPMQLFASRVAAVSVDLVGIPVLREGNIIQLANSRLEVAEACSGMSSLMSLLALSVVFAYLTQRQMWKRVLLFFSTFPIAIIANALRVAATAALTYYFGPSAGEGFFHGFSGWFLFVVTFLFLFAIGTVLAQIKRPQCSG